MNNSTAEAKLQRAYAKAGGVKAIPWQQILELLMKFLGGCSAPQAKAFASAHPVAAEFLLRRQILSETTVPRKEAILVAKVSIETFNAVRVADIESLTS